MDGKSCILCPRVLLQWRCSGAGYKPTLRMVSCNRRCVAVRGQPAIAGDDYSKRSSSPTCHLASVPLVTLFHEMLVVLAELCRDTSPEWDVSQEHGCVTSHRGCNVALSDELCVEYAQSGNVAFIPVVSVSHVWREVLFSTGAAIQSWGRNNQQSNLGNQILAAVERKT